MIYLSLFPSGDALDVYFAGETRSGVLSVMLVGRGDTGQKMTCVKKYVTLQRQVASYK